MTAVTSAKRLHMHKPLIAALSSLPADTSLCTERVFHIEDLMIFKV
jgi:hypothetical protein